MSPKQETFCRLVVAGNSYADAYRQAYGAKGKPATVANEALRLRKCPAVKARIAELSAQADATAILTRQRKREVLRAIVEDSGNTPAERIAAIRVDNEMTGDNSPAKAAPDYSFAELLKSLGDPGLLPTEEERAASERRCRAHSVASPSPMPSLALPGECAHGSTPPWPQWHPLDGPPRTIAEVEVDE